MRSDLNMVTNNLDVISYDVKDIINEVDLLNSDMAVQKHKTAYIENELESVRVTAEAGLIVGTLALGM